MSDKAYRLARLNDQTDALDAIRKLEQQLSQEYGSTVALVAYATAEHEDGGQQIEK